MRRLPVYIVLDASESMQGEPIEAVRNGIRLLASTLRTDPYALETAYMSVIVFDCTARQLVPLTELVSFEPPDMEAGYGTALGDALRLTKECVEREVQKPTIEDKGDWKPLVFLMVASTPTDDWREGLDEFRKAEIGKVIACAAGPNADMSILKQITEFVVSPDAPDSSAMCAFFNWISASISTSSIKIDLAKVDSDLLLSENCAEPHGVSALTPNFPGGTGDRTDSYSSPSGDSDSWGPKQNLPAPTGFTTGETDMRRLPVYIVLDVSGSMHGEPIEAVRNGMQLLVSTLRTDPYALETAHISVILFDDKARQVVPLTELMQFQPPNVEAGSTTALGDALRVTKECVEREVRKTTPEAKGDWKPLIFLMTDGVPTDDWQKELTNFRDANIGRIIACAAGPNAETSVLKQITDEVARLDTVDSSTMAAYFKWVSASISTSSKKIDLGKPDLPPPPPEITLV